MKDSFANLAEFVQLQRNAGLDAAEDVQHAAPQERHFNTTAHAHAQRPLGWRPGGPCRCGVKGIYCSQVYGGAAKVLTHNLEHHAHGLR
jgi:hypothetical protein